MLVFYYDQTPMEITKTQLNTYSMSILHINRHLFWEF